MEQAQGARFEHGENGRPQPYPADETIVSVYAAGAVIEDVERQYHDGRTWIDSVVLPWREEIFGSVPELGSDQRVAVGRFEYAGPKILDNHGQAMNDLAANCIRDVADCDVLFAWIDRHEQIGTIAEIGAAHAWRKPIFVAFADESLSSHFYFAEQLATVAIIAPDAVTAWRFFDRWQSA